TEEDRLGAIGDIDFVINKNGIEEDTVIIAGDNFFDFSLLEVYKYFEEMKKDTVCTMEIFEKEKLKGMGVAKLDKNNKIIELIEKPKNPQSNNAVFAIYFYKKETIALFKKYLKEGNPKDAPGYFLSWLHKKEDVLAFKIKGICYDIGTLESYEQVRGLYE
ncbi:MAG: sugar phosphate nucleotidyltransferase, partial [Defluviitaleaceae bacterium]|nr:sugar phosphate nucleotidyltransferase [Defluviitaleaceae bacterium]